MEEQDSVRFKILLIGSHGFFMLKLLLEGPVFSGE
jgi:hypothetical protein